MRLLVVEDEPEMAVALQSALRRHDMIADHAGDMGMAMEMIQAGSYDAIILDRGLPDGDGLSLIPKIRRHKSNIPVIVLTARGRLAERVAGLDGGADDYLAKPFAFEELLARLRTVMRRPDHISPMAVKLGRVVLDLDHREARVEGMRFDLPRRELLVLEALIDIGQRGVRLETSGTPPEIASLISAVNEALRRLDDGYERHQRFLADAAHELRTPIAILGTRVAALPPTPERVQLIADVARLTTLTEQLLDIERLQRDMAEFKPVSLLALGKRVVSDMAPLAFPAGYRLDLIHEGTDDLIHGDEAALERALASLIQNAIDHGGGKGTISIRIAPGLIDVCDDGPGVPAAERDRIFEPFYGLKPRSSGTGLGLHLVRQIVELHGGHVTADTSPTGGARLTSDLASDRQRISPAKQAENAYPQPR